MAVKVAINGFGRIGRLAFRQMFGHEGSEIVAINDLTSPDMLAYLLKYDSIFRNFPGTVEHAGGDLVVNGHKIKIYSESDAAMINWADSGAEYIIESTGANTTTAGANTTAGICTSIDTAKNACTGTTAAKRKTGKCKCIER